jgi:hypothetical protein
MDTAISAPVFAVGLLVGMLTCLEIGRRAGARRIEESESARTGLGAVEGAAFALFGLLVAFTFSGAASRFDWRRGLIVEEANAIGTAYLRLDLLPSGAQPEIRELFRKYLDSRLQVYAKLPNVEAALTELTVSTKLQSQIWSQAVSASRAEGSHPNAAMLLLPALNQMIDITTTRTMAARTHPPVIIFMLLFGVGLICAALAGYAMGGAKKRAWFHIVGFAVVMVVAIYVILDMEYPRTGLIRVDAHDQVLRELRESMK